MAFTYNGKDYTQEQVDQAYAKANADQRSALNKQFKLSYDVNTGKPSQYSPVNTGIVPPNRSTETPTPTIVTEINKSTNTTPVATAPVKGSFGDMSADNVHAA